MPRTWKLKEARTPFSRRIKVAQVGPQIIFRHGRPVAVVTAFRSDASPESFPRPISALEALRGDFNFTALPAVDWLERDRRADMRDLDWEEDGSEPL